MKQSRPYPVYTITPKGERAILSGHPWVYAEELTDQPDPAPANGGQDPGTASQPQRQRPL